MGAITVLLPIYVTFLGVPHSSILNWSTLFYTLVIALLMVSRLPVYSGKRVGTRVPPEMVGPVIVIIVLSIGLLIAYPWILLTLGTLAYLGTLPFGWLSYRRYQRRSREPIGEGMREAARDTILSPPAVSEGAVRPNDQADRPSRLN
jgi:CDP-diacylglycerol--serine O-phosphatidyltransferase